MQKKLIAVAIAAALAPAAAMADTTVYGRIHTSIDSISGIAADSNNLSVNSSSSRFGVKGSEDLGGGLTAVYQLESGVTAVGGGATAVDGNPGNPNGTLFSGMRDTYIGLAGNWGTFLAGRLPAENQYVYDSNLFADQIGDAAQFTSGGILGVGRANSALHYVSPGMNGFNAAVTYLPGNSVVSSAGVATNTAASHGDNSWGIKLNYAGAGFTASLTYFDVSLTGFAGATATAGTNSTAKPVSLAGSYDFGSGMVSAQYVKNSTKTTTAGVTTDANTRSIYNIGGKFNVSGNSAIKAQYSHANNLTGSVANANTGAKMFAIGYDYNLSKRTGVYVAYATVSNDAAGTFTVNGYGHGESSTAAVANDDPRGFSVGLTHNF